MNETRDLTPEDPRSPEEISQVQRAADRAGETLERKRIEVDTGPEGLRFGEPAEELGPPPLTEPDVRRWLERIGKVVGWVWRRLSTPPEGLEDPTLELDPPPWRFTEEELSELTPPATRVLNRRVLWLAGVIRNADEIELGFLLLEYVDHNLERVREAREAAEAATTEEPLDDEGEPDHRGPEGFGLGDLEEGGRLKGRP